MQPQHRLVDLALLLQNLREPPNFRLEQALPLKVLDLVLLNSNPLVLELQRPLLLVLDSVVLGVVLDLDLLQQRLQVLALGLHH